MRGATRYEWFGDVVVEFCSVRVGSHGYGGLETDHASGSDMLDYRIAVDHDPAFGFADGDGEGAIDWWVEK